MALPQTIVIAMLLLMIWEPPLARPCRHRPAGIAQIALPCAFFCATPKGRAPWYNGTGVMLYITGMMVTAFAIRTVVRAYAP